MIEGFQVGLEPFICGSRRPLDNILFAVNYCQGSRCDLCKAICVNNTDVLGERYLSLLPADESVFFFPHGCIKIRALWILPPTPPPRKGNGCEEKIKQCGTIARHWGNVPFGMQDLVSDVSRFKGASSVHAAEKNQSGSLPPRLFVHRYLWGWRESVDGKKVSVENIKKYLTFTKSLRPRRISLQPFHISHIEEKCGKNMFVFFLPNDSRKL